MGSKPLPQRLLHAGRTVLKQSYNAGRSWSRFAWPKVTSIEFLTFLIAFGTLVMAVVTYWNQQDAHEQVQILKRQVQFKLDRNQTLPPGKAEHFAGEAISCRFGCH
jgi:hypothetical protein